MSILSSSSSSLILREIFGNFRFFVAGGGGRGSFQQHRLVSNVFRGVGVVTGRWTSNPNSVFCRISKQDEVVGRGGRVGGSFLEVQQKRSYTTRLLEVGKLENPKTDGSYDVGQVFLHRVFGYRGVILFPWTAKVFDRDLAASKTQTKDKSCGTYPVDQPTVFSHFSDVKSKPEFYYQALIDSRDVPFVRCQTEAVTFLGEHEDTKCLFAVPGLDYISHEDVIPYSSTEKNPVNHDLFDKFLQYNPDAEPSITPRETLKAWKERNHPWLVLSDVHKETTENIRITVTPFYMGCREPESEAEPHHVHWWRYCIRIENVGNLNTQLRERHWRIFSLPGTLETVAGKGVVGLEPIFTKDSPAFQYSSHVSLPVPSGHMWGTFRMEREDGCVFDCRIPPFSLESRIENENK